MSKWSWNRWTEPFPKLNKELYDSSTDHEKLIRSFIWYHDTYMYERRRSNISSRKRLRNSLRLVRKHADHILKELIKQEREIKNAKQKQNKG